MGRIHELVRARYRSPRAEAEVEHVAIDPRGGWELHYASSCGSAPAARLAHLVWARSGDAWNDNRPLLSAIAGPTGRTLGPDGKAYGHDLLAVPPTGSSRRSYPPETGR